METPNPETTTDADALVPPAAAGSTAPEHLGPWGCKCQTLAHRLTGDGCDICQPKPPEWYTALDAEDLIGGITEDADALCGVILDKSRMRIGEGEVAVHARSLIETCQTVLKWCGAEAR